MPAISADTMVLPRIPAPDPAATDRPVVSVTTAPSGLEGEGFPVRRAFAGVNLRTLDPFVHMDQMGEVEYAPGEPEGTPWHPHRDLAASPPRAAPAPGADAEGCRGRAAAWAGRWMSGPVGGTERAERTRGEREWIAAELAAAYGLHGRSRLTGDPVERARQAVKWRIRHAIGRVEQAHPALGRHLRNSIRTGVFCAYLPEPTSLDRLVWCSMRPVGRPVDTASAPG